MFQYEEPRGVVETRVEQGSGVEADLFPISRIRARRKDALAWVLKPAKTDPWMNASR